MKELKGILSFDKKGNLILNQWIEWNHTMVVNKPSWLRELIRNLISLFDHCLSCTALDGCYFVIDNKPQLPLHEFCDCSLKNLDYSKLYLNANAVCDIKKFTEYIFKSSEKSKGKNKIFYELGFTVDDSKYLQEEFCNQALIQYLSGNYILKNLDERGQRLAIPIKLRDAKFYSGWMVYPEGKIINTTPFGGWIK